MKISYIIFLRDILKLDLVNISISISISNKNRTKSYVVMQIFQDSKHC